MSPVRRVRVSLQACSRSRDDAVLEREQDPLSTAAVCELASTGSVAQWVSRPLRLDRRAWLRMGLISG